MTNIKIVDSLEQIIRLTPNLISIILLDRDGIPILHAGGEFRERTVLSSCYMSSIEQGNKLGMGQQKFWIFTYETYQIVMLHIDPFVVFLVASPSANVGVLCNFQKRLAPVLKECEKLYQEISTISV